MASCTFTCVYLMCLEGGVSKAGEADSDLLHIRDSPVLVREGASPFSQPLPHPTGGCYPVPPVKCTEQYIYTPRLITIWLCW